MTGEPGAFTQASSPESEIGVVQRKTYGRLSARTTTGPHDRITSPNVTLQHQRRQIVPGGDSNAAPAAATAGPRRPLTATPPRPPNSPSARRVQHRMKRRIIGKRDTRKGIEYMLVWQRTWKPKSELGNAQGLVQEFAQRLWRIYCQFSQPFAKSLRLLIRTRQFAYPLIQVLGTDNRN